MLDGIALGVHAQRHARAHLTRYGYTLLDIDASPRFGAIGFVARRAGSLMFADFAAHIHGTPYPRATRPADAYRRLVRQRAVAWLADHPRQCAADELRFDATTVSVDRDGRLVALEHTEAFA